MAKTSELNLYLFGDQTFTIQPHLQHLLARTSTILPLYELLSKAYSAIRTELYTLPPHVRDDLPRFTCLQDLLLWDPAQAGRSCLPLDMALTTLYHLGSFVSEPVGFYGSRNSRVVGLCTGAFAAAAVSCSTNTYELVPLAVDAIIAAFRTGILVTEVARRVVGPREVDSSWAVLVAGSGAADLVDEFCEHRALPLTSKPYVSAYATNGITVSGPPSSLAQLVRFSESKGLATKRLSIYGPYHAPHLFSDVDAQNILLGLTSNNGLQQVPLLSKMRSINLYGIHFAGPLSWRTFKWFFTRFSPGNLSIVPIGTNADQSIYGFLKQTGLRHLVPSNYHERPISRAVLSPDSSTPRNPKLAIIGMSGRFPDAKDNDAFWNILYNGLDVHKPVPQLHWDARTHVDTTRSKKNTSATPFGCWLENPEAFDPRFFNISPREALQIDPAQRLALMTAYEAIEEAGIVPNATPSTRPDRVGVFYGLTSNDWMETNSAQQIDTYFIPGGNRAFIPGRINYFFKFSGPSYAVDTACSSSLAGIHLACNALWMGDIDTAIAGGTNILTNPDFTAGLDRGHFLSKSGNCKTFDDGADGYCRGEGVGTLIIKRLDDALADRDPILGVILGAYTNHSAESESITRPHAGAQQAIFNKILSESGVSSNSVSYIEMHGTGTQAGDATEMMSVLDTFAPPASDGKGARARHEPLFIGSAKSNIGHGGAASGVSSVIKVLQMMRKNTIVPHCGIKTKINHRFPTDLDKRNVHIALKPIEWNQNNGPRRVFVNNFSAAGGNSALLIEDAPPRDQPKGKLDSRVQWPIAVTARACVSLQGNLRGLQQFLRKNPDVPLDELSYTTTARRIHHQHRVLFNASSTALQNNIGVASQSAPQEWSSHSQAKALYSGMGKQLLQESELMRVELRQLDCLAQSLGFPSILHVIEADEKQDVNAFAPIAVQLAGVSLQIALSRLWASWGVVPAAVVGHSLGEYAALNVAGVLSDTDTLFLVGSRARLLVQKCTRDTHEMLVVRGSEREVATTLRGLEYETACLNSPTETVLAGPHDHIDRLGQVLAAAGLKSTLLKVPYVFHSSQLNPILQDYIKVAESVTFGRPNLPIIRPLDATIVDTKSADGMFDPEYLAYHARQPVRMLEALSLAKNNGLITDNTIMMELGPHPAVLGMVKACLGQQVSALPSLQRGRKPWEVMGGALKGLYDVGASINWIEYQRNFGGSHTVLSLPAYSWDLKDYWIQYVNDWSLRKGDPPLLIHAQKLESTTIHSVVEKISEGTKTRIVVEADIARKDLSPLVQGHEVDGIPLCTPSVYADMALTLGKYLLDRYKTPRDESLEVDVGDMTISKALILRGDGSKQPLQAHAEANWDENSALVKFMTFDNKGKLQEHSRCMLRFKNIRAHQRVLQDDIAGIKQKLQRLRDGIVTGETARFNRPMVYRAIRPLARFHDDYRAIDEVVLNSNTLEASSRLSFGTVKREGSYHSHPAIIDALTQSCGFAMNCNDSTDLDNEVYMNHGWGSLQLFEPIDFEKQDKLWYGDVVIMDGDKVVAFFGQIAIQGVPRRVLKVILSLESGRKGAGGVKPATGAAPRPRVQASTTVIKQPNLAPEPSSQFNSALVIIAEESGIDVAELTDSTKFSDVGIDSLLSLTISARLKEELDLDADFSVLFLEHPTVKDLRGFLRGFSSASDEFDDSATSTVSSFSGSSDSGLDTAMTTSTTVGAVTPSPQGRCLTPSQLDFSKALEIIAEESGVAREDLTDDTQFTDCGIDSLLSLVITSRFQDAFEIDIPNESLFLECQTVGALKQYLMREMGIEAPVPIPVQITITPASSPEPMQTSRSPSATEADKEFSARQKAVDALVTKYTVGFKAPTYSSAAPARTEKVVMITGATGSLGSHIAYFLAQQEDIKQVVCVNREQRDERNAQQYKSMRDKGIKFPDKLKHKMRVIQTDTAKPLLGLSANEYDELAASVTHLIHNAWPMSVKRPLSGFEPQFQVFRNLIDFGCTAASRRPKDFRFGFQMVSSIGVVGNTGVNEYKVCGEKKKIVVPEAPVKTIRSLLNNGYAEAKWGCERMLEETIQRHCPDRFRAMVVRLGQIAGFKTSGYWNPMEHFGFLVKSSQTLNCLPDVDGKLFWTPVNDIAETLAELVLADDDRTPHSYYHIDNPVGQSWSEMNAILADALHIPKSNLIPFGQWLEKVRAAPQRDNPAVMLADFLEITYPRLSCGGLVLDVKNTLEHSKVLSKVGPVSEVVVRKYIHIWKEIGVLKATEEEDKANLRRRGGPCMWLAGAS
ncbi:hypothetical protein QBC38DRAFT_499531 [Podospora fimiseda]|uniref:Polyketide synthase n=1 Tax=Podospora fimiseda TaxID=252190 RepID=A0AAN7H4G9_9PEZI|nr:hypothetical protein QBC38DRAFT_499531 [Podospora fimiseda]